MPQQKRITGSSQRKRQQRKSRKKGKKRKLKRRHAVDKHTHARRRHARTLRHSHKHRVAGEIHTTNALLTQLLKTVTSHENKPYHYDKRHHSKDPEYKWFGGSERDQKRKKFREQIPYPDVSFLRPQGEYYPPHQGNFPDWHQLAV